MGDKKSFHVANSSVGFEDVFSLRPSFIDLFCLTYELCLVTPYIEVVSEIDIVYFVEDSLTISCGVLPLLYFDPIFVEILGEFCLVDM